MGIPIMGDRDASESAGACWLPEASHLTLFAKRAHDQTTFEGRVHAGPT